MEAWLNQWDCTVLKWVYRNADHPIWLNHIVGVFSDHRIWIVVVGILLFIGFKYADKRYYYSLLWCAVCAGISDVISAHFLKPYFGRVRPCLGDCISTLRWACASQFSFPSNHATNAMAMATVGLFLIPSRKLRIFLLLNALLIGLSRIYFGVHYPGDVLGGFLFGGTITGLLTLGLKQLLKRRRESTGATRI